MPTRAYKAFNENVKVYCVMADTPAEIFEELTKFCIDEKIDHVSAVTTTFWDEDFRYSANLYY